MVFQENEPRALDDGGAEPLSRRGEILQSPARHLYRRPAVPAVAELRVDPTATGRRSGAARSRWWRSRARSITRREVIIFDEPTATLTPEEKQPFLRLVGRLKTRRLDRLHLPRARGGARSIADRITVLRDGEHVVTDAPRSSTASGSSGHGGPHAVRRALRRSAGSSGARRRGERC